MTTLGICGMPDMFFFVNFYFYEYIFVVHSDYMLFYGKYLAWSTLSQEKPLTFEIQCTSKNVITLGLYDCQSSLSLEYRGLSGREPKGT